MTGRYATTHGVFLNDVCLSRNATSLAEAFRLAGYQTGFIGKWHLDGHGRTSFIPPERRQGFEFWRACECTHDYSHSAYFADTDQKLFWPGYDAAAQTGTAQNYIQAHRQQPFLLFLSWGPPHNPYNTAPAKYAVHFSAEQIRLRANVPPQAAATARRDLAGYYAHGAALDECVGRIVATLRETGLADDTILVFTSDHGDMLGSHAQQRKQRPWDEAVLVPFLVRWPQGLGHAGRTLSAPFGTPDIMPTLLGLCGIKIPTTVEGEDRSAWLRGESADEHRGALIECVTPFGEWTRNQGGREFRGLRTVGNTYVRTLDGPWLLYDDVRDPFQEQNLVGNPKYAPLQAELDAQLNDTLKLHKDAFRPGREYIQKWGYKTDASGTVPYGP
jgi:arylsulfatase A-like enzyme